MTTTSTPGATSDTTIGDPLDDTLVASGTCITTEDGTGDCTFEELAPGAYVVSQTAAPAGYTVAEDVPVTIAPGMATTVAVTNSKSSATIEITLTDDRIPPSPLEGGEFVIVVDDGDGLLGDLDVELGRCTTGPDGACAPFVDVPLGAYVVHQAVAPAAARSVRTSRPRVAAVGAGARWRCRSTDRDRRRRRARLRSAPPR